MNINLQPKPEVKLEPNANKGIVSKDIYFVKKVFEEINQYFFPAHLIRNWKPKAELIYSTVDDEETIQYECDFNREIQNCFVEDFAEEVFLRSPPPCFVIIGKLGSNIDKLSQKLADEYGSVLINVDDIVNDVLATETETAKFLNKLLRLGISLTLNYILALISYKAHTAEARHRGYVLSGLPSISLYKDLSAEQQLNYLFSWENKPTVFIYVSFKDEDLVRTQSCIRYEIAHSVENKKYMRKSQDIYEVSDAENDDVVDEEEGDDNDDDDDENNNSYNSQTLSQTFKTEEDVNVYPSRCSIRLPRDEESNIWNALELFEEKIKPVIDLLRCRIDPQYFITIDSRIKNDFEVVKAHLSLLPIWKVPLPFHFNSVEENNNTHNNEGEEFKEDEENETDIVQPEDDFVKSDENSPQAAFLSFFTQKTFSPKFRWELSHYNYICPVSLRAGEITEGKPEFAVIFMKYIYFLRDKKRMEEFLRNPRPYVLPVRPKPPARFIVIGYPSSGKTSLAKSLAEEFSVPLIDLSAVLNEDLREKKETYQQYCKQRAECAEIIRLTAQAWKDWRLEEEQRITLIEEWTEYIRKLLLQRIRQFYGCSDEKILCEKKSNEEAGESIETNDQLQKGEITDSEENMTLEVRGFPIPLEASNSSRNTETARDEPQVFQYYSTPSTKIIRALRNEDFDFDKNGFEVEANIFFSTLWNSFSTHQTTQTEVEKVIKEYLPEESEEEQEGEKSAKSIPEDKFHASDVTVNWCNLLPPQSLSSFILKKKIPCTMKERRKSFRILLKAASKAYWEPSPLKSEFVKWRLPCFMDIPLCEIFHDNPLLLHKYCPHWLKERPLTPDIVDVNHPAVAEAGRRAANCAKAVTLKHTLSEIGILLGDTIEKAEKDGMRISGEVISPGGWVVDNMVLDMEVWCALLKRNALPNYVFILSDSDPQFSSIISNWYELQDKSTILKSVYPDSEKTADEEEANTVDLESSTKELYSDNLLSEKNKDSKHILATDDQTDLPNIKNLLLQSCIMTEVGEKEIDRIFARIKENNSNVRVKPRTPLDAFSYSLIHKRDMRQDDDSSYHDDTAVTILSFLDSSAHTFYSEGEVDHALHYSPLGAQFEIFTDPIVQYMEQRNSPERNKSVTKSHVTHEGLLRFFKDILTYNKKLEKIKEWLSSLNQIVQVREIDIDHKKFADIFSEVIKDLYFPFIKKPRELEPFEIEELREILDEENEETKRRMEVEGLQGEFGRNLYGDDDIRIYGESGPYCIVNLERNILLKGNFEYCLRYYGKLYFFWSQECKVKFLKDPEKYAPYYSPIRRLPPLRIYVVGPIGSGKTSLAFPLSDQLSMHYHDFVEFLTYRVTPHYLPRPQKITALGHSFIKGNSHNEAAKAALEEFESAPESIKQYWLNVAPWYLDIGDNYPEVLENLKALKDKRVNVENVNLFYECLDNDNEVGENALMSNAELIPSYSTFINISSHGDVIKNYIHNCTNLNPFIYERSMGLCWTKAPHCLEGIVIENFPMRYCDTPVITQNHWIPDIVIEVKLPAEKVIERNIDKLMKLWEEKLHYETKEEQYLEDTILNIHKTAAVMRRSELMQEKRPSIKGRETSYSKSTLEHHDGGRRKKSMGEKLKKEEKSISSTKYRFSRASGHNIHTGWQRDEEIDSIIETEMPPLHFQPIFQTIQEGKAEIIQDILQNYEKDINELNNIKAEMKEMQVRWLEIDNSKNLKYNLDFIYEKLHCLKSRLNQKGEFAFSVSPDMAEKLLLQGFYFLSKFGRMCPVQIYRKKNPINMYRPLSSRNKIFPIAYRNYIYFVAGENERWKFLEDPIKYIFQEPNHPNIPLRVAVIGPPKSGKSSLSQRLGLMFNLKVITMGSAIRFVLEETSDSNLKKAIKHYLKNGCFLPLSLKIEALLLSLNDPACITQGFVFDGIPFQAALAQSLAEKKKLPFVIISLVAEDNFGRKNREKLDLSTYRLPYRQKINLKRKYNEWNETYQRFAEWNRNNYNNLYEVDAKANSIDIFYKAYDIIRQSYFNILKYVQDCPKDGPLSLQYLCTTPQEFDLRKSAFGRNCLVCWVESQRLVTQNEDLDPGLYQYSNHYYWICQKHIKHFMKNPKLYLPPRSPPWPNELPRTYSRNEYETTTPEPVIHGLGRCPVTCTDFPDSLDWEGSWDYSALYANKVYLCKNKEMLTRFLAQPWRYCAANSIFESNREVKSNAVQDLGPPQLTSLPPIGFLEQSVAQALNNALQIVGSLRPIYPNMTPKCTACIFLALYLKVHNCKSYKPTLEKEYLEFMIANCKTYSYQKIFARKRTLRHNWDLDKDLGDSIESECSESKSSCTDEIEVPEDMMINAQWQDFKGQADKKLWSAKQQSTKYQEMKLLQDGKLEFISETPKYHVVLRIHVPNVRGNPLPPISHCYNYLYTRKPNLKLSEKFNINYLYQPLPNLDSPFAPSFVFNPNKEFALKLYVSEKTKTPSNANIWEGKRTLSGLTVEEPESGLGPKDREYLIERYLPRFQIMDYNNMDILTVPKVIEHEPIFLQPQLDYFNTLLFSHFFQTSHVLRCYEWSQSVQHLEYSKLLDKNLALCDAQSIFFRQPKVTESERSRRSIASYQQILEAATPFLYSTQTEPPENEKVQEVSSSVINFIQSIILDKLNQMFVRLSSVELSYDSYEVTVQATESETTFKKLVCVQEILPFPPLIWDLTCRPYYCYLVIKLLFNFPLLDHIAHERHVSLLDGIREPNDNFSFVRYPTWISQKNRSYQSAEDPNKQKKMWQTLGGKVKLVYDFFDLPWTALLTYPFSWAYNSNNKDNYLLTKENDETS